MRRAGGGRDKVIRGADEGGREEVVVGWGCKRRGREGVNASGRSAILTVCYSNGTGLHTSATDGEQRGTSADAVGVADHQEFYVQQCERR